MGGLCTIGQILLTPLPLPLPFFLSTSIQWQRPEARNRFIFLAVILTAPRCSRLQSPQHFLSLQLLIPCFHPLQIIAERKNRSCFFSAHSVQQPVQLFSFLIH